MEELEDQKMKHVCKLCNKSYPCGRSLGGHMRSHIIGNSAESEEEVKPEKVSFFSGGKREKEKEKEELSGFEANNNEHSAYYGLRQNPKKSWRLVVGSSSSSGGLHQENVCKECGKGFQSLKALCGHMACHSERGERVSNNLEEDHSWTSGNQQQLVMDSQSDTEAAAAAPKRRRRSKRMRYKKTLAVNNSSSLSLATNGSSSVSEIEQEQEKVAMCLMMLSRDSGNWGGLNSVADSSDNNSVVLEARSLSTDMRIGKKEGVKKAGGGVGVGRRTKSGVFDAGIVHFENSDSGYFRNGAKKKKKKKVESDVSIVEFLRNDKFKKLKVKNGSGFEVFDAELGKKGINRLKCSSTKTELVKNLIKEEGYGHGEADGALMKCDSRKRAKNVELCKNEQKRIKFECLICKKVFQSAQALGGHKASHKRINGCFGSTYESGENSIGTDVSPDPMLESKLIDFCSGKQLINQENSIGTDMEDPDPMLDRKLIGICSGKKQLIDQVFSGNAQKRSVSKKSKGHECPICYRVFRSGQALGGHKRSHLVGGSEDKSNRTPAIKPEPNEIPDLLDLNLPAPIEDVANFMPW